MKNKKTFQDLQFNENDINSQALVTFSNGYGASVVIGPYSYGGPDGLYELAILNKDGDIDYTTPIAADVIGHCTRADIDDLLKRIAALPPKDDGVE